MKDVANLTELNEELVKSDEEKKLILLDMYTDWCGPCKYLSPLLKILEETYQDKVTFLKANIQNAQDIGDYYEVIKIPLIKLFKNGYEVDSIEGAQNLEYYKNKLNEFIATQ